MRSCRLRICCELSGMVGNSEARIRMSCSDPFTIYRLPGIELNPLVTLFHVNSRLSNGKLAGKGRIGFQESLESFRYRR